MFFFIGGIQPKTVRLEKQARACPFCSHFDVRLKRIDQYISLFFIPILRIKKGIPFLNCENCHVVLNSHTDTDSRDFEFGEMKGGSEQRCRSCGKFVAADYSYCPYCGKRI
jgi:RNA polymerase subunit RPABC4/transcription elongation factor Spt4